MQMCLLSILFRSQSLSCQELYQHVSWLKKQAIGVEIFQINRHNVMTYHNSPNIGRCGAEMVEEEVGGKAAERRSVYSGTCTVRSAENKTGFLLLVLRGGWGRGAVTRLRGVNAFCQLKRRPAWRVSMHDYGHFSSVSLLIPQSESRQEKKEKTNALD